MPTLESIKTIRIAVTKKDILNGKPVQCTKCPVALAINRRLKPNYYVAVVDNYFNIWDNTPNYSYQKSVNLPLKVTDFIKDFDRFTSPIQPITFNIDIPEEFLK
jgi:hypothetical protein